VPDLNPTGLLSRLEAKPPAAALFFHGEEEYLREEVLRKVLERVLDPGTRDFNFDQLRGADASPEGLASVLATPPMMAEYRVVLLRDVQGLSPRGREVVERAFQNPPPGLIFIVTAVIPSGSRAKFYDNLRKGWAVGFPAVDPLDLPGWIVEHAAQRHELEVEVEAARALAAAIGSHLGILATELEKIAGFVAGRRQVTLEDVRAVGGYVPRVDRWGWFDTVGERKFEKALAELPELLASGESAVSLVIGLGSHLLRIGLLVDGGREGLDRQLKPNQRWLANRLQPQARRWTLEEIDRGLEDLLRTDRLLKSASLTDRQAMEELLLRLLVTRGQTGSGAPAATVGRATSSVA
jgi:DNA polymerase III subunit delta